MVCPYCKSELTRKRGFHKHLDETTTQRYFCNSCKRMFSDSTSAHIINPVQIINQNTNKMTEEELRSKYDNKFILRNAVKKLENSIYVPETEFISKCGIKTSSGYRMTIDSDEFQIYRGVAPGGVVYWSHPESISKMKNEGILK
jgi:transposase-like protein